MNSSIQSQLDDQIKKKRSAQVVDTSEAPVLSLDVLERDKRDRDIVEINLKDQTARVVETSDAPKLTKQVLVEKGKPIKTVELLFDGQVFQVGVRHGKPMRVEVAHSRTLDAFKERIADSDTLTAELLEERETAVKHLLIASMVVDPVTTHPMFSYQHQGDAYPIEDCSQILLSALWEAYTAINFPEADDIYQVAVLRGTPLDTALLLGETFETYPVGDLGKKFVDMSDEELEAVAARSLAQRRVLVASMLPEVGLSLNGEGAEARHHDDRDRVTSGKKEETYPVEDLSEAILETLFQAYRVTNIGEAGYNALQRFSRLEQDRAGQETDRESVDHVDGGGETAE